MSAGFAADRLLLNDSNTQLVFEEHPTRTNAPQSASAWTSRTPAPTRVRTAAPTPPLKRIQQPARKVRPSATRPASASARSAPAATGSTAAEATVARLTNSERAKAGCGALRIDARLRTAARRHSADMAANDYFSHMSPNGATFVDRVKAAGYSAPGAENIAKGYQTPADVVTGWMKSPGHRANILNCGLKAIGVGVHYGTGGPWWTQDFGWE